MYAFSNSTSKPVLSSLISHDLEEVQHKSIAEIYVVIKTMLKALTGSPHEYTMEEALFILREEQLITDEEYEKLKTIIVSLIFFKYATHYEGEVSIDFQSLKTLLISAAKKSEVTIETYAEMRKNPVNFPDDINDTNLIKQHKKELYNTEQQLLQKLSVKNKAHINFPDFFTKVTELELKDLVDQDFSHPSWEDVSLDLHVKYQLVKGKSIDWIIEKYVQTHIPEDKIRHVLHDNRYYLKTLEDSLYMKELQLVTIAFTFSLVTQNPFEKEEGLLVDLGYKKDHIDFVKEQIFKRVHTS